MIWLLILSCVISKREHTIFLDDLLRENSIQYLFFNGQSSAIEFDPFSEELYIGNQGWLLSFYVVDFIDKNEQPRAILSTETADGMEVFLALENNQDRLVLIWCRTEADSSFLQQFGNERCYVQNLEMQSIYPSGIRLTFVYDYEIERLLMFYGSDEVVRMDAKEPLFHDAEQLVFGTAKTEGLSSWKGGVDSMILHLGAPTDSFIEQICALGGTRRVFTALESYLDTNPPHLKRLSFWNTGEDEEGIILDSFLSIHGVTSDTEVVPYD